MNFQSSGPTRPSEIFRTGVRIAPGVVDSGFASLGTFVASGYAVRYLESDLLGVYAIFFSAVGLLGLFSNWLWFTPISVAALELPRGQRTHALRRSLVRSLSISLPVATLTVVGLVVSPSVGTGAERMALLVTASTLVVLAPTQDHIRSVLHLADRSFSAATVSLVLLTVVAATATVAHLLDVPRAWIPMGSMALGNAVSSAVGIALAARRTGPLEFEWPPFTRSIREGTPLLAANAIQAAVVFGSIALVAQVDSAESAGQAEAARLVAAPLTVFGAGLAQVANPRLMEVAASRSASRAFVLSIWFIAGVTVVSVAYFLVVFEQHPLNPMEALVPVAYERDGLVAFRLIGLWALVIGRVPIPLLLGARRFGSVLRVALVAAAVRAATVAAIVGSAGPYSLPASDIGSGATQAALGASASARELSRPSASAEARPPAT